MESKETKGLEAYAKLFAVLVAVVPVICLVLSLFYDWSMFRAAGISFSSAPTSIADHFRTTLVWMPYVFILAVFVGFLYLYHVSRKATETGKGDSKPKPNDFLWIRMDKIERIEILNDSRFQGLLYWISELLSRNES